MAGVFRTTAKNRMLDQMAGNCASGNAITHASLHTGYPPTACNEVCGGCYARQSLTFGAAACGTVSITNCPAFCVPGCCTTVASIGYQSSLCADALQADDNTADETFGSAGTLTVTSASFSINDS